MERNNEAKRNRDLSQMNADDCHAPRNTMNSVLCVSLLVNGRKEKAAPRNYHIGRAASTPIPWVGMASHAFTCRSLGLAPGPDVGPEDACSSQLPSDICALVQGTIH